MDTTLEDETNGAYYTITLECSKLQTQIDLIKDELLEIDTASLKTEHNLIQSQINLIKNELLKVDKDKKEIKSKETEENMIETKKIEHHTEKNEQNITEHINNCTITNNIPITNPPPNNNGENPIILPIDKETELIVIMPL